MNRNPVELLVHDAETHRVKSGPVHEQVRLVSACPVEYRMANIRSAIERGLPTALRADFHNRLGIVVGYGPSLRDTWQELLTPPDEPHDIFTVSGSHSFLVERGIRPYGHTECDPRPHKAEVLRTLCPTTRFFIASRANAAVFDRLADHDVTLYHTGRMEAEMQFIRALVPGVDIVPPASMIGLQCVQLLFFLGYRRFRLYGLDCSFDLAQGQHAGPHPNSDPTHVEVEVHGRRFTTTMSMICSFTDFFNIAVNHPPGTFDLRGDGMLQHAELNSRTSAPGWSDFDFKVA